MGPQVEQHLTTHPRLRLRRKLAVAILRTSGSSCQVICTCILPFRVRCLRDRTGMLADRCDQCCLRAFALLTCCLCCLSSSVFVLESKGKIEHREFVFGCCSRLCPCRFPTRLRKRGSRVHPDCGEGPGRDLGTPLRPCVRACQESGRWENGKKASPLWKTEEPTTSRGLPATFHGRNNRELVVYVQPICYEFE
ncbi:hypothetical protein IG631_06942 [Alternaria alternata]|nr:hypothetical protein IG631_06942 [Alternaria alternata]